MSSSSAPEKALPKHPTNKKPYPHSPAGSIITPAGDHVSLTYEPLDVQKATKEVSSRWAGAAVVFLGMTRDDRSQGSGEDSGTTLRVQRLEYEAYTPLALKTLHSIVHRARSTPTSAWPPADLTSADVSKMDSELESALSNMSLQGNTSTHHHTSGHTSAGTSLGGGSGGSIRRKKSKDDELNSDPPSPDSIIRIALINRLGPVEVGEASILVAVSSPHRRRAFEVAEWLLEETKRKVPIWKREVRVRATPVEHKRDKSKEVEVEEDGRGWVGLENAKQKDSKQNGQAEAATAAAS